MPHFFALKVNNLVMICIPTHKAKIRTELETKIQEFLDSGGVVTEIISNERRSKKESLVRRHLFFSVHHPFYSKETGIATPRLKTIQKTPFRASDEEIETLWVYFRKREWSVND